MCYVCCGITLLKTELTTDVTASSSCLQHYSVSSRGYGHCTVVFFTEVQSNNSKNWHSTNNLWFSKCVEVFVYLTQLFIATVLVLLFTVTYREMNACIIWHNQLPKNTAMHVRYPWTACKMPLWQSLFVWMKTKSSCTIRCECVPKIFHATDWHLAESIGIGS